MLLDLDGTLLDTAPDLAAAANALRAERGLAPLAEREVRDMVGDGIEALAARALGLASAGAEAAARLRAHYARANGQRSRPFPGVAEGLARLRGAGLGLACVTNKPGEFARPLLAATGLAAFLDAVVTPEEAAGARKPAAGPFLAACRALAVSSAEALAIGDSENDVLAARAAGLRVWLVPYGYRRGRDVHALGADGIVESLRHAAEAIVQT